MNQGDVLFLLGLNDNANEEIEPGARDVRQLRMERRRLRDASNPFHLDATYFRFLYRMPPALTSDLVQILQPYLAGERRSKIPEMLQVLITLRVFATGSYQRGIGQNYEHPVSQTTVCRIFERVANALVHVAENFIVFARTREQRLETQRRFQQHIRIPGIHGLMDYFVVKFLRPSVNEEAFFHHKHAHSMNVQIIADDNYVINAVRICPGSNNDRHVWNHSDVKVKMEELRANEGVVLNEGHYYLLGDSGYTPSSILLTPVHHAQPGTPETLYTTEHCRSRCKIEQCFGILTNVWRVIKRERVMRYDAIKVAKIIMASIVLHNFRRLNGHINNDIPEDDQDNNCEGRDYYADGIIERQNIINRYYT